MTEVLLITLVVLSVGVNLLLGWLCVRLMRAYLQLSIVASPLPVAEKAALLSKTTEEVASSLPKRNRDSDVVPIDRPMGL